MPIHSSSLPNVIRAKSPLKLSVWRKYLRDHPSEQFAQKLLQFIEFGVPIGYKGPDYSRICPNWPSSRALANQVQESLLYDVNRGRKAGPFPVPPLRNFVGSPMGAFLKKRSSKIRVIHDLSWPPGSSINSHIDDQLCSLHYSSVDDAVKHVLQNGRGTLMSKLDIKDAYKHVVVATSDWHLLGISWPSSAGVTEYYLDLTLPFGLRSSPYLFEQFALGLHYVMEAKGATHIEHYLDDYFTCGPSNTKICHRNIDIMLESCNETGFEVNHDKLVRPTTELEFLGIIIDSTNMQLKISNERLNDIYNELIIWNNKLSCTKRELLSITGKLSFICRVVRSGRTFIRRMFDLSKSAKYLHYKIKLNKSFREDIKWWLTFLPTWNGVSMIHTEIDVEMYADSSDKGIGCVYKYDWFVVQYVHDRFNLIEKSINWRELYAIVKAVATWGHLLRDKKILLHCDNEAVTYIINSGTSRNTEIMKLVRILFYICAHYNIECICRHIAGVNNISAEYLSRLNVVDFFRVNPNASSIMTTPHDIYYDGVLI